MGSPFRYVAPLFSLCAGLWKTIMNPALIRNFLNQLLAKSICSSCWSSASSTAAFSAYRCLIGSSGYLFLHSGQADTWEEKEWMIKSVQDYSVTFGRHESQMTCCAPQQKMGTDATSRQTEHSRSFSFASIFDSNFLKFLLLSLSGCTLSPLLNSSTFLKFIIFREVWKNTHSYKASFAWWKNLTSLLQSCIKC